MTKVKDMRRQQQNSEGNDMQYVVKDNALINASYNLDLVEQRVIVLAIIEARETGKGISANDALTIHASSYIETFNVEKHTAYKALKEASKDLFARQFSYQERTKKGNIINQTSRWVSQVGYADKEGCIQLIFAPAVVPLITQLEKQFTTYDLEQVARLSSKYAMRLYELLISWRTKGSTPIYELEDFRNRLGLGCKEYSAMSDFKKYVLDLALNQINEHTDIKAEYKQHKKGVRISGFSFSFKPKKTKSVEKSKKLALTDKQRHFFASKLSELPEMSKYSEGTESYEQFAVRIAEMLKETKKVEELSEYLNKVGFAAA